MTGCPGHVGRPVGRSRAFTRSWAARPAFTPASHTGVSHRLGALLHCRVAASGSSRPPPGHRRRVRAGRGCDARCSIPPCPAEPGEVLGQLPDLVEVGLVAGLEALPLLTHPVLERLRVVVQVKYTTRSSSSSASTANTRQLVRCLPMTVRSAACTVTSNSHRHRDRARTSSGRPRRGRRCDPHEPQEAEHQLDGASGSPTSTSSRADADRRPRVRGRRRSGRPGS